MNIRPYRLIGDSILQKARNHFLEVIEGWRKDWGLNIPVALTCNRIEGERKRSYSAYTCYKNEERQIWIDVSSQKSMPVLFARELFSISLMEGERSQDEGMASATARRVATDLLERMVSSCGMVAAPVKSTEEVFADLYMQGSGALTLQANIGGCVFDMLLNGPSVAQLFPHGSQSITLPAATKMQEALADVPVSLPIELGCVEANVASVLMLNIGDVVKLDASVDLPLAVKNDGEAVLFHAYLGKLEGNLAIEVVNRGNV